MKKLFLFLFMTLGLLTEAQIVNIPDSAFKTRLLAASPSTNIASTNTPSSSYAVTTYHTIDTNGDGQIQVSEAQTIQYLKVNFSGITNLTGIEAFTNLKVLDCSSNQISSLNISQNTALLVLICLANNITSLNLSQNILLIGLACDNNQLTNLNVSQNTALTTLECSVNQLTSLDVTQNVLLTALSCGENSLVTLNVSQNTMLNTLNCQNNQLSSLNVSQNTLLISLYCYANFLTTLDLSQNTELDNLNCKVNNLTFLNIKDGSTFSYLLTNFDFSYNPTLNYICVDESEISSVQQKIFSYGYTNCHINSYCSFNPGGIFYSINCANRFDGNNNGCDTNDAAYPNLKLNVVNGANSNTFIDNNSGAFSIPVQAGSSTVTPVFQNPVYFTASPASVTINFPTQANPSLQNFCITTNGPYHDLEITVIPIGVARPGFICHYKLIFKNNGSLIENGTVTFNYNDAISDFISASLPPTSQTLNNLSWNFSNLSLFETRMIDVVLNLNSPLETPSVNSGDVLQFTSIINGLFTDETTSDNTFTFNQTVLNSLDPNDKTCLEGITIPASKIGSYVPYQIRFENTGTFAAQNIVVKDIINTAKFDISSLQIISSSHSCYTRINGNKVEFIFENINLPFDDANNDGYVVFKIKSRPTLTVNSTISNSASIYFDYNFPIITNTYTSTYTLLANESFTNEKVLIYPNPVSDAINIVAKSNMKSVALYDIQGRQVQTHIVNSSQATIDLSDLQTGNYILKVYTEGGTAIKKIQKL